jgi:hypothetical protein
VIGYRGTLPRRVALLVSDVIRTNETQVWFVASHVVEAPTVHTDEE